jgi:hypothetical protein
MAHKTNVVLIPFAYEFRLHRADWSVFEAEVLGYWNEFEKQPSFASKNDDFAVEVDLKVPNKLLLPLPRSTRLVVKMNWSLLPKRCFEDVDGRLLRDGDPLGRRFQILICSDPSEQRTKPEDAWELRNDFLALGEDIDAIAKFLNKWGHWDEQRLFFQPLDAKTSSARPPLFIRHFVLPDQIQECQSQFRSALTSTAVDCLTKMNIMFPPPVPRPEFPHFLVLMRGGCRRAIEMTIAFDLLRKVRFRKCARPDCHEVFEVKSKHRQRFCQQYCAHLESVRRQRRKQSKKKKQLKAKKGE